MFRVLRVCKTHKGGILIEFTFCIPVCITLLFFVNDHYRFYELKSKIRTSAYLAASMIQQIGNSRIDKQLTKKDIRNITFASCLNFFHTKSMFSPHPFGIYYVAHFYYVKRINSNSYQYQKVAVCTQQGTSPETVYTNTDNTTVSTKTQAQVEALHPDLVCQNDGEERVLIECVYRKNSNFKKSQLGLFVMNPPETQGVDGNSNIFVYDLTITPKPGLFPVKW